MQIGSGKLIATGSREFEARSPNPELLAAQKFLFLPLSCKSRIIFVGLKRFTVSE